jgi:hypothetical protein
MLSGFRGSKKHFFVEVRGAESLQGALRASVVKAVVVSLRLAEPCFTLSRPF